MIFFRAIGVASYRNFSMVQFTGLLPHAKKKIQPEKVSFCCAAVESISDGGAVNILVTECDTRMSHFLTDIIHPWTYLHRTGCKLPAPYGSKQVRADLPSEKIRLWPLASPRLEKRKDHRGVG